MYGKLLIVFALATFVTAEDGTVMGLMETKMTRAMDELNRKDSIGIYGDMVTLEKVDVDEDTEIGRVSEDPLVSRIEKFLRTRRLQVHLPNDGSAADVFGRALGQKDVGVELRGLTTGASEGEDTWEEIDN